MIRLMWIRSLLIRSAMKLAATDIHVQRMRSPHELLSKIYYG
jgi:hypothetical protein